MGELKFTVLPDLQRFNSQLQKELKDSHKVKVDPELSGRGARAGGAGSGRAMEGVVEGQQQSNKQGKKTNSLLGGILRATGILGILSQLKPITDLLQVFTGFVMYGIITVIKTIKKFPELLTPLVAGVKDIIKLVDFIKEKFPQIKEWLGNVWNNIKVLPGRIWNFLKGLPKMIWGFLKALPQKIWGFMVELPGKIWELLQQGFSWVTGILSPLLQTYKSWIERAVGFFTSLWETLKQIPANIWSFLKALPANIWSFLKEGFNWIKDKVSDVWDSIKDLPGKIWDKMKGLGRTIANSIKGVINNLNPFKKDDVNDAIISGGKIIRTNPNDAIIATQSPGRGGGNNVVNNFYGLTEREMVERIMESLGDYSMRGTRL